MDQTQKTRKVQMRRLMGRTRAYFSNPANIILLVFFVALCFLTLYPLLSMMVETVTVHSGREARAVRSLGLKSGDHTLNHFKKLLFTLDDGGEMGVQYSTSWLQFYGPLLNTLAVSLTSSCIAILFGGTVAFLITRTNIRFKKFVSTVFVFPYIMPSWTLALFWQTFFKNVNIGTGERPTESWPPFSAFMRRSGWFTAISRSAWCSACIRAVCVYPHRRHPEQHGRQP